MGKLKYTSNGIEVQNELTIVGSDNVSVNVKEKLNSLEPCLYTGEFYANDCLTPGIYQYITVGRTGLDTTTDDYYSLLVMQTNANTIRQIAFGSKIGTNVYSRVCVNGNWDDPSSNVTFEKITQNVNTINLTNTNDINAKFIYANAYGSIESYITDKDGKLPAEGVVEVTADNVKLLQDTLIAENDAISAFKSNWQAYYQIGDTWYSQTVTDYLKTTSTKQFNVGDKLKISKKSITIANYFKQIVDWKNIDISSKMSATELIAWNAIKAANGGLDISDGECIVNMINNGLIYSAYSEPNTGGTTYQLLGSTTIQIYSYTIIAQNCHSLENACSTAINTYGKSVATGTWSTYIGSATTDETTSLMEVYAGWGTLEQTEFHLCLPINNCKPNSIIKLRCFYRKGENATDYQYDSDAYMYVSNTKNNIPYGYDKYNGTDILASDYVNVKSLGSYDMLGTYPNSLTEVRDNFYTDETGEYAYQYLKTNYPIQTTLYLHIYGTFDTIKSWFCLDYKNVAVYTPSSASSMSVSGDSYINAEASDDIVNISANIIAFEDAVASAHTVTSMTMTQRGETGNIYFLRNEGSDETHDDGEFYAWNFSADPSSISSELYYTKGYPELNVYDDLYVYSGTPVTFTPMRNESGEQMFMVSEYGSVDIEKVDGLLSASDMKGVIGSVGEFYGMTLTDSTSTYHLTYYPNLNFTKDYEYYYGFKFTQEDIEFVVFTKSLNASVGDIVTLYIFKDKQESEEAKSIVDDGDTDVTVISTSATKDSGLYKYINDADNAINVTAEGDTFINAEAENRNVIIHAHTASISKTSDGQLECVMLKYTYLDTSDNKVKTVWGDWVRKSSLDDGKYYAWYMRLQATVDESTAFYTTFIPGESSIGGNITLYKKNDDGEFVESDNFVSAEIIALNNPFINGEYSDTGECKVSKSYGWSSTIGTKTTFHYYQFYTMFEPLKEGEYYVWRGLWCTDEALWYSKDYPTAVGQVIDMYYKEDDEIKLNTGCTYTVTTLTTYSDYNQDGLATAYDVKTYVDKEIGDLTTLETSAKTDVVSAINELEGKIITKNMINTLWSMFNICVFNTPDTKAITDTFKSAWGIGVTTKATLLFTSDFNSIYAIDMAEYSDINLSSSIVSGLTPYLAFDEGDEFSFTILIDGVSAYTVNNINGDTFAASLLTDEYIQTLEDEAGASGDFLKLIKQNKGKYCVDCHKLKTVYGYDYDGETYWYKGDEYSSGTETLYSYQNEAEDKKMWLPNKFDETSVGTEVETQYYKYDDPTTSPSLQGNITITIKSKLA